MGVEQNFIRTFFDLGTTKFDHERAMGDIERALGGLFEAGRGGYRLIFVPINLGRHMI